MSGPRSDHPWRQDRLGQSLRAGLAGQRSAQPAPVVWERVAAELDRSSRRPSPSWQPPAGSARLERWAGLVACWRRSTLRFTPLAAVLLLYVVAWASLSASARVSPHMGPLIDGGIASSAQKPWHGLDEPELSIQPVLEPRPINRSLPPGHAASAAFGHPRHGWSARQEAFNRAAFPLPQPEPHKSPASPVPQLNVQ